MRNRSTDQAGDDVDANVNALLTAINEVSKSEAHHTLGGPQRASIDGHGSHTWHGLAETFELDIHDFNTSEVNR